MVKNNKEYLKKWKKDNPEKIREYVKRYQHRNSKARKRNIEAIKYIKECQNSGLLFSHIIYEKLLNILEGNNENINN